MSEEVLSKSGAELFKELYRIYAVAEPADYFKNGVWKDDIMKMDIGLVEAHRKESGAPDAPELKDVEMPELPTGAGVAKAVPGVSPGIAAVRPAVAPVAGAAAVPAGGQTAAAASIAELRLIALFVAKWKLDPTKAKTLLAKLTPTRRRYVIQNFKTTAAGPSAFAALETYISTCQKSGAWDKGVPVPATAPAVVAGVKRPIAPVAAGNDPAKKPRVGPVTVAGSPGANAAAKALAAKIAASRPAATPATVPARIAPKAAQPAGRPAGALIKNLLGRF
mmetsp:Transcript_47073/g.86428  ORF Transcript_47073/g.86428 Transcript_47073/m.86428 type:complete len:278 (-) Transcript_47073:183-1016(-)